MTHRIATIKIRLLAVVLEAFILLAGAVVLYGLGWLVNSEQFFMILGAVWIFLLIAIQIVLVARRSQSIGKYLLNIQVVHNKTGQRLGFWRYFLLREFVGRTLIAGAIPIIDLIFFPIYFSIDSLFIFSKQHRTLHDRIATSSVVYLPENQRRETFIDFKKL